MERIEDIMRKNQPSRTPSAEFDPMGHLRSTTGLDVDPRTLPTAKVEDIPRAMSTSANPDGHNLQTPSVPLHHNQNTTPGMPTPQPSRGIVSSGPTDQLEEGEYWEEKIDVDQLAQEQADKKFQKYMDTKADNLAGLLDGALESEESRLASAIEITSDDEKMREKMSSLPEADDDEYGSRIVKYDVEYAQRGKEKISDPIKAAEYQSDDVEDLLPAYGMNDSDEDGDQVPRKPVDDDDTPDPNDTVAYSKYVRELEVVDSTSDTSQIVIGTVKDRQVDISSSGRNKGKFLNDQAFLNSITKFKKDNFPIVSVPLVNSGFVADVVGTGEVDLEQLYTGVNENTPAIDYVMEKMKIVMRNIVATHPKVDPMDLRNMIHYRDYEMLAWAHVCATLNQVEIATNCQECGKPFRISANPRAMVINMDELYAMMERIRTATSIEQNSLMTTDQKIITNNGFEITIGHPSYADYIRSLTQARSYASGLSQLGAMRFFSIVEDAYFIRNIKMPNGIITTNIQQLYMAMSMLTEADMRVVHNSVERLKKQIITPKFGIAKVTCPHCHKTLTNIPYENLEEMVFFHFSVSRMILEGSDEADKK